MSEWISVKERLPEDDTAVLIYTNETEVYGRHREKQKIYHNIYAAIYDGDRWYTYWCWGSKYIYKTNEESPNDTVEVTHWMPLPEPPEEADHG